MKIVIENLTKAQELAIEDMLATWVELGGVGSSRWTAFYADGDGNFRPKVTVDGRLAQPCALVSREELWPDGHRGDYKIDFDTIGWKLESLKDSK